jgi:hypothetical protein
MSLTPGVYTFLTSSDPDYSLSLSPSCIGDSVILSNGDAKICTITYTANSVPCTGTPWGTMLDGTSNTAYLSSLPAGTCTSGTLSGSYTTTSCIQGCTGTLWGNVSSGYSNTAYQASSVTYPSSCTSETRICTAGTFSGTYINTSCSVTFITPTVTTETPVTNITQTTAHGTGTVVSDGGATISVSGLVWSTTLNPTTIDSKTTDGWAVGGPWTGIQDMTGLMCNTLYHVRAYATNSVGTSYGSDIAFTTSACNIIPTVISPTVSSITNTTATLGANVSSLGIPSLISERGTCFGTSPNPTINCLAEGNTITGVFTQNRTGLIAGTIYYYRGYAINSTGIAYSSDGTVTTTAQCLVPASLVGTPTLYNNSSSSSAIVSKPTGVVVGDIMFAHILHYNGTDRLTTIPSGWLPFDGATGRHKNGNYNQALYYKVVGISEGATYTFSLSSSSKLAVTISAYRGCFNTTTPIDSYSNVEYVTNNTTYQAASLILPLSNTTVLMFPSIYSTSVRTFTNPLTQSGGWTEDYDHGANTSDYSRAGYRKFISSSGATGVIDSIGQSGSTVKHAFAVALHPL